MASSPQIEELIAKRNEIDEQIKELQRQQDGIIHVCNGANRRRDILFMNFDDFKVNDVEFDYEFDIENNDDIPEFFADCGSYYGHLTIDNDNTTIDAAINKVGYYYEVYKKLREFLLNMKNTGIKYIADASDCEAAEYNFEDDN